MANQFQLAGAQPTKQVRFAPLFTNRFFQGLWTQRNPLRDAGSTRIEEKYVGTRGDAMIAGSNIEISNRLTPIRRPGASIYNSQTFDSIDYFYSFRMFSATDETIKVMADTVTTLYDATGPSTKFAVYTKSALAQANHAQTYMQSVGNTLFFTNGVDTPLKWVQTILNGTGAWQASTGYNPDGMGTYLIDPNGNLEQLIATIIPISTIQVDGSNNVIVTTSSATSLSANNVVSIGSQVRFPNALTASFLDGVTLTVTAVTPTTFTASSSTFIHAAYGPTADTGKIVVIEGGTAVTGTVQPTWPTSPLLPFAYTTTDDNLARWVLRGNPVENWGIVAPTIAPSITINGATTSWSSHTYYSAPGVVIDSNNNIWQVTVKGTSGSSNPFTAHPNPAKGDTVTDGSPPITWTCVTPHGQTTWASNTAYTEGTYQGAYPWAGGDGAFLPDYDTGSFLTATAAGVKSLFMLQRTDPMSGVNVPISTVFGGAQLLDGTSPPKIGWTTQWFPSLTNDQSIDLQFGSSIMNPQRFPSGTPVSPSQTTPQVPGLTYNFYKDGNSNGWANSPLHNQNLTANGVMSDGNFNVPWPGQPADNFEVIQYGKIRIPHAGMNVGFFFARTGTYLFGFEGAAGATVIPGGFSSDIVATNLTNLGGRTQTPYFGYTIIGANNTGNNHFARDTVIVNFPNAGVFGAEFVYGFGPFHFPTIIPNGQWMLCTANNFIVTPEQQQAAPFFKSGTTTPPFGSAGWNPPAFSPLNTYPSAIDSTASAPNPTDWNVSYSANLLTWFNLGPATDFVWTANTPYTLPSTILLDTNNNQERSYETGISGTTAPTWATGLYQLTADQSPLQWINEGPASSPVNNPGTITATSTQGYIYYIALVNTMTNTVSNASPASISTGKFTGTVVLTGGLPPTASIDPQVDYVAIFRTQDGGSIPYLIPGTENQNTVYTIPLTEYIASGYTDTTPDSELNILIQAPLAQQNTPPSTGLVNVTYHLNRIFGSIGNTVVWSSGSDTPAGNGVEGFPPLNSATFPSLVKRIVATSTGALVFTISDIYLLSGQATTTSPIVSQPYATGIGLLSFNALDVNGTVMYLFTSDSQVLALDPSVGFSQVGFPVGDQFTLATNPSTGLPWFYLPNSLAHPPTSVYVTWHVDGSQDHALFVADGQTGWFRMTPTASPESGLTWSPFATIVGGCRAVQSIEVLPGKHRLLLGPTGNGMILQRDTSTNADNGSTFTAYFTIGSINLALPGQIAELAFVTTDSIAVGTRPILSVILDEITGPFEELPRSVLDPPQLPSSLSLYSQRFYFSQTQNPALCRHMQIQVGWPSENIPNELISMTLFGAYMQED